MVRGASSVFAGNGEFERLRSRGESDVAEVELFPRVTHGGVLVSRRADVYAVDGELQDATGIGGFDSHADVVGGGGGDVDGNGNVVADGDSVEHGANAVSEAGPVYYSVGGAGASARKRFGFVTNWQLSAGDGSARKCPGENVLGGGGTAGRSCEADVSGRTLDNVEEVDRGGSGEGFAGSGVGDGPGERGAVIGHGDIEDVSA